MTKPTDKRSKRPAPVALFCVHGMGQQLRFDAVRQTASGLFRILGEPKKQTARLYRADGKIRERLEVTFHAKEGSDPPPELHIYEGYWAPITEGRVTLRDVMDFLFSGAFNGLKQCGRKFRRWMFGADQLHDLHWLTFGQLLGILLVVTTLVGINLVAGVAVGALVIESMEIDLEFPRWLSMTHLRLFTTLLALLLPAFVFIFGLLGAVTVRKGSAFDGVPPGGLANLAWILVAIAATLITWLPSWRWEYWWWYLALGWLLVLLVSLLFLWRPPAKQRPSQDRLWRSAVNVVNRLVWAWIVAFGAMGLILILTLPWARFGSDSFDRLLAHFYLLEPTALIYIWIPLLIASWVVRRLLVQYVGDVAAYVSPHKLDRFNTIRREIKREAVSALRSIYESGVTRPGVRYEKVGLFAHSLGSVIAYDALNALMNEDELANRPLDVVGRTKIFVSFGSPLDKTAFIFARRANDEEIRGRLAEAVQPLIKAYKPFRRLRWVNVFSHRDIIAGALNFYDTRPPPESGRVCNIVDEDALITLAAHTEYWQNRKVFDELSKTLLG